MPGDLFIALVGERFDGHDFIPEAAAKGARGTLVEHPRDPGVEGGIQVQVPSTMKALGQLASEWRKGIGGLRLAAITGSNGKTTTKEMAYSIVSIKHKTLKNEGNLNNEIGLPLTLLNLESDTERAVVELGMNDFGELRRLADIALPDTGAITNIGRAHLEKLGSLEGVARAKAELVEHFTPDNTLVVNSDDPWVVKIASQIDCHKIRVGINAPKSDINALNISTAEPNLIKFDMHMDGGEYPVRINGIGLHNVSNALVAAGIAHSLGSTPEEIQSGLEIFTPQQMRLEVLTTPSGLKLINDTYNANPDSMRRGIEELVRLKNRGKAVAVLGDMLELGKISRTEHSQLGEFAASMGIDAIIAYGEFAENLLSGARGTASSRVELLLAHDHLEAAAMVSTITEPGDLVLIKGSRGMEMENVVSSIFNDHRENSGSST